MNDAIQGDLSKLERRELHLWILVLGLLMLLGTVVAGRDSFTLLGDTSADSRLSAVPGHRIAAGLFLLIPLFCLYTVHTRILNGRMKALLAELNRLAASSANLDEFLPSIAHQIASSCSVTMCQLAFIENMRSTIRVRAMYIRVGPARQSDVGRPFALGQSWFSTQALNTLSPILLCQKDIAQLSPEGTDYQLLTGGLKNIQALLIVPMAYQDRLIGLVILARTTRLISRGFNASTIAMAQALARHAATAIDQAQLKADATHDPLTNLYNRRLFGERLSQELDRAKRKNQLAALLLCDLDRFKAINDTLGHQVGDDVLKAVAKSIQASTRGTDLVFRWGGDEIVVILSETSRQGVLVVADRIRQGVLNVSQVDIDVSIGVALYPEHGRNEDELIRTADRALYIAKKSGDKVRVGEEEYELDRGSIKVVFQPVVNVSSDKIIGYEALTRDPQGRLSATQIFEKYRAIGRINELKQLTLSTQISLAEELGLERVFINVDCCVLSGLAPIPRPFGVDVVLELSELEALHDLENHLAVTQRWRDMGYKFAIDDFGAGFISFPFLAMLEPEYVKLDRSTILQAVASQRFKEFLKSLLYAVRTYAITGIIAEGIEETRELRLAEELGISLVQGFLFGRPQELPCQTRPYDSEVCPSHQG